MNGCSQVPGLHESVAAVVGQPIIACACCSSSQLPGTAGSNECDTAAGRLGEESPQVRQLAFAPDEGGQEGRQAGAMW